ncbi:MAG: HAD family phosphatase [Nanoarchaeota archaeon]|nr:HAD family phosphatase [Nanoarchaeota archaeon]
MITAVLFDYGGVVAGNVTELIVTTSQGIKIQGDPSLEKAAHVLGMSYEAVSKAVENDILQLQKGEITEASVWRKFSRQHNLALPDKYETLLARDITTIYSQNEEVIQLIRELKSAGINVGVLSNIVESQVQCFEQEKRYEIFDSVTLSCRAGVRKPEEKIYQTALSSFGKINPEDCVFIDDVENYVTSAIDLGMKGIHFRYGINDIYQLKIKLREFGLQL